MPSEKPRLLVIGSRGFLGSHATGAARSEFDVIEAGRTILGPGIALDVTDPRSVDRAFTRSRPDLALLLAAISDIDRCEQFPDAAKAVNLYGAENVVDACVRSSARLLFTSTGAVFDGLKHGYSEEDPVTPVSVYGKTKAGAERAVLALGASGIVVRIALVIGFSPNPDTNSLLDNLKKRWAAGESVDLPVHEQRNPIDASTASRFMLELLQKKEIGGVFHLGCLEPITRYDLGLKVEARMGFQALVKPQLAAIPGRAPRGPDHFLLTDKLRAVSSIPIPTCEQAIERCFDVSA